MHFTVSCTGYLDSQSVAMFASFGIGPRCILLLTLRSGRLELSANSARIIQKKSYLLDLREKAGVVAQHQQPTTEVAQHQQPTTEKGAVQFPKNRRVIYLTL